MIIGYDFWGDGIYYDADITPIIEIDNDGVAFDTCNPLNTVNNFTLKSGTFDELHITKDVKEIDNSVEKTVWGINSVLLAKFQGDLSAGTISVNGYDVTQIEIKRRKKGEELWKTYYVIDYDPSITLYNIIDKFIESEEIYEYCLCPIALDSVGNKHLGNNSTSAEIYITYDHAHIFDNTASYNFIYNLKFGNITNQISANTIETLGSPYPYVIYGETNYLSGSIECLLVSEESAVGNVDLKSEKNLRNNILSFFNNKKPKILKNSDGTYMLIEIVGTPTLIPSNEIMGVYQLSFEYVQVGDINDVETLSDFNFQFNYNQTFEKSRVICNQDPDWFAFDDENGWGGYMCGFDPYFYVIEGNTYKIKLQYNIMEDFYLTLGINTIISSTTMTNIDGFYEATFIPTFTGYIQMATLAGYNGTIGGTPRTLEVTLIDVPQQITKTVGSE